MPLTGEPARLADFTVRLFLPDDVLADEERVNHIVCALNNLPVRERRPRNPRVASADPTVER